MCKTVKITWYNSISNLSKGEMNKNPKEQGNWYFSLPCKVPNHMMMTTKKIYDTTLLVSVQNRSRKSQEIALQHEQPMKNIYI